MRKVVLTILGAKFTTIAIIFLAFSLLPFGSQYYFSNFVYPPRSPISLQTAFSTWDAQHYLFVSEKGYQEGGDSAAFPPLFPFLIFLGSFLTRNSFLSGIILANVFSFFGFMLFYMLVKRITTEKIAYQGLLFLLFFPTSFYFSLIYTESLFFLLVMIFFICIQQKKILIASLTAFLLPLTRLIGIAIFFPFVASYILEYHNHSLYDEVQYILRSLWQPKSLILFSPFIGLAASMGIMYFATGSLFAQFSAQQHFISQYSFFSIFNPTLFLRALFTFPLVIHGFTNSLLDRLFFLGFIAFLPLLYKRVSFALFVYALIFGLLPVLSGSFMSYMRYLLVVFPIFIACGKMSVEKKYQQYTFPLLYASILLQGLFLIMHSLNYWVA